MGYSREIIIYQNPNLHKSQILKLYKQLKRNNWTLKNMHEKDEISYSVNPDIGYINLDYKTEKSKFEEILQGVELQRKWISFKLTNKELNRTATLFHEENKYTFDLEIYKNDDDYEWFKKFNDQIKPSVKEDFYLNKIEWKNNYGNEVVRVETGLYHEGVLILASSNQLKKFYSSHQFNYDFPKGLTGLLENYSIIAINAYDSSFEIVVDLDDIEENQKAITSTVFVEGKSIKSNIHFEGEEDELLILNHADFTMICNNHKGNYKDYGWKHIISIPMNHKGKKGFKIWRDSTNKSSKMIFKINHSEDISEKNELINIEKIPTHNKG